MFSETNNPYRFKYLITGISGPGIKQVYLPEQPPEEEILFKEEQRFVRPEMSDQMKIWVQEMLEERKRNPDYIHAHQLEINEWEEREWERSQTGVWFWNDNEIIYITGDHYKYLTTWEMYFGYPDFWEADKEIFYWTKYWEEDTEAYGGTLNTLRRGGKSGKMGFWIANRCSTNFKHFGGMQGEDNTKIQSFYTTFVQDPFYKLPYYFQPEYDTNSLQKKGIVFKIPPKRHQKNQLAYSKKVVLESQLDYRTSEANKYDQAALHSFVNEEGGKTLGVSVWERWKFVKPCLRRGKFIRGKAYWGTTVEYMDVKTKGGKAYQRLCLASDFDKRGKDGRTETGLYAALMPADCMLEGFIDEHGRPQRKEARQWILDERETVENNPKDYADLVRKYPLDWNEVFYVSADKCEFNVKILQDRKAELQLNPPPIRKFRASWENNQRFTKVVLHDDPVNGWLKMSSLMEKDKWNDVGTRYEAGQPIYYPKNDMVFRLGLDPIDHGVVVEGDLSAEGFGNNRRSRSVLLGKRLYDSSVDGHVTIELLEERAKKKYQYKTGVHFVMMDVRPNDPNVFFERVLMICWLLSCKVHVERQKPGVINWMKNANCGEFLWHKYVPEANQLKKTDNVEGTDASPMIIQEYTSAIATDVEYFGHTYPFIEVVEDDLLFDPQNTREFDYTVSQGNMELACKMRDRKPQAPVLNMEDYFHRFDSKGRVIN